MSPRRRDLLAGAGTVAAFLLAGCGSDGGSDLNTPPPGEDDPTLTRTPTPDPVPNLDITDFASQVKDGTVVVDVTVENVGDATGSGTLVVTLEAGDTSVEREKSVSVEVGGSKTYSFEFDVDVEAYRNDGGFTFTWRA